MSKKRRAARPRRSQKEKQAKIRLFSYEITWKPILDRRYRQLPDHVKDSLEELYDLIPTKPHKAIPRLLELVEKYPDIPVFYNYLSSAYSLAGENEKAEEAILDNYRRNPHYLFARLNYAELCLARDEYDKVAEILDHKFDLKMLYPKRERFHISEVTGFFGIVGRYFLGIGQHDAAEKVYEFLDEIAPDHPATRQLRIKLIPGFFERLSRQAGKRQSSR